MGEETLVDYCIENEIRPVAVLSTHRHWDHTNGNKSMLDAFPGLKIYGGKNDKVPHCTNEVIEGDLIDVAGLVFNCIDVPCHTKGHVLYYINTGPHDATISSYTRSKDSQGLVTISNLSNALFTGDTLFVGGCG